jgi:hypothetical protein
MAAGILARELGTVALDGAINDALSDQRRGENHYLTDQPPSFSMRMNIKRGMVFCSLFAPSP